jgi:hypothetical protein
VAHELHEQHPVVSVLDGSKKHHEQVCVLRSQISPTAHGRMFSVQVSKQ